MITYTWKLLEITENAQSVKYLLTATDGQNTVQTEGNHVFSKGTVNLSFEQIKESNLVEWIEKDTSEGDLNSIKSNLEAQLKQLDSDKKVEFPWLADTFTPGQ